MKKCVDNSTLMCYTIIVDEIHLQNKKRERERGTKND